MKYLVMTIIMLSGLAVSMPVAQAKGADPIYTTWRDNDAVGGYDVVSFFSGKPLEGKKEYQTEFKGVVWKFSAQANLDLFKTNPEAFIPQYGGYCAWAAAHGKLAKGSPKYWQVRDGKLYLNFNKRIQDKWENDIPGFIDKADANWPDLLTD